MNHRHLITKPCISRHVLYTPNVLFLFCLPVNVQPPSTAPPACCHAQARMHTCIHMHMHMHTIQSYFKAMYWAPSMDVSITKSWMKQGPFPCSALEEAQSPQEKTPVHITVYSTPWPSHVLWHNPRQANQYFFRVLFAKVPASSCYHLPQVSEPPLVFDTLTPDLDLFPHHLNKNLPHNSWLIFSKPPVLTQSFWTYTQITENNLCLFPSNGGYKHLSYADEDSQAICLGHFLIVK